MPSNRPPPCSHHSTFQRFALLERVVVQCGYQHCGECTPDLARGKLCGLVRGRGILFSRVKRFNLFNPVSKGRQGWVWNACRCVSAFAGGEIARAISRVYVRDGCATRGREDQFALNTTMRQNGTRRVDIKQLGRGDSAPAAASVATTIPLELQ